jgi:hypothetical protein
MATIEANIEKSIEKMETQLKQWNARLAEAIARSKAAGQEARLESRKRMDELKVKIDVAQAKLADVKKAGAEQWESLRASAESAWKQAEAAFKKLVD